MAEAVRPKRKKKAKKTRAYEHETGAVLDEELQKKVEGQTQSGIGEGKSISTQHVDSLASNVVEELDEGLIGRSESSIECIKGDSTETESAEPSQDLSEETQESRDINLEQDKAFEDDDVDIEQNSDPVLDSGHSQDKITESSNNESNNATSILRSLDISEQTITNEKELQENIVVSVDKSWHSEGVEKTTECSNESNDVTSELSSLDVDKESINHEKELQEIVNTVDINAMTKDKQLPIEDMGAKNAETGPLSELSGYTVSTAVVDDLEQNYAALQLDNAQDNQRTKFEEHIETELLEGEEATSNVFHEVSASEVVKPSLAALEKRTIDSECDSQTVGLHQVNQDKNLYGHIYNLFGKQQVSTISREAATAFTEDDLQSFYYNPALNYIVDNVEDFIKETLEPRRESEFYELLNTYQNSSRNLRNVENDIEILRKKCLQEKKTVWSTEAQTVTVQGMCKDQQKVSYTHSYETASFHSEQAAKLGRTLDTIKNTIHETFTLAKYSCQLARIHITSYIYELHAQSPVFCGITEQSPVIGVDPSQLSDVVFGEIRHLRDCLNALFVFVRKPTNDEIFYNDVTSWIEILVALLLRSAPLPDHVFLLNHVLRCPPGVTRKMVQFIQPLLSLRSTPHDGGEYLWHSPRTHHFVTMLATLLLPIRFREKYLAKMKPVLTPDGLEFKKSISWVMVDEDGEEDENPEESWMLIPENDLIALFLQFPFDSLFKQLFGTESDHESDLVDTRGIGYNTGKNLMQVFAFSTCLIQILGKAFSLYSMTRYREFVKRLGRAIRTIVMHVSRQWSLYKSHFLDRYGDNETTFHLAFGMEYSLEKLQLEYDQFFIRASQQIFSAHRLGAWQFLIDMPFESVSSKMMWTCYRFLHKGVLSKEERGSLSEYIKSNCEHQDVNDTKVLIECFKSMTESEVLFLLTTFANMARARTSADSDFITAVVREVYDISYVENEAPEFLSKTCKDLLGSICSAHPFVMSLLLERIEETMESIREECVALFKAFPVEIWRPKSRDIQIIRNWLLRVAVDSSEHQLARYVLTNMNWQYQDVDSDILFLPRCLHRAVAILLVETCALRLPNQPGGIAVDVFKESPGILEQVTQLATSPYQRIVQHYSDQDLYKWLWEVMMFLHLHEAECPTDVMRFTDGPQSSAQHIQQEMISSYEQSDAFKSLSKPEPLNLDNDEALVNVLTSASNDGPLACYAALGLSNYGHDPEHLGSKGLLYLSVILEEGHVFAVCRIIANFLPTFFTKDFLGLSENTRFTELIDTIIHSEARWKEEDVLDIMSGVIQRHVQRSRILPATDRALFATEFWLRTLCSLTGWNSDVRILQLLNSLLKFVFRSSDAQELVVQYFVNKHKDTLKSLKEQGFLSSLLSFVISHSSQSTVIDVKTLSSYSYFCYYILCSESFYQDDSGLKLALVNKLHEKPGMCIETALKKAISSSKDILAIPSCNLDIYRWADLAMAMEQDHPILAAVWQKFFYQFLRRVPAGPGMAERGSVGLRFFESTEHTTHVKKLKARLIATVEHHKAESTSRRQETETTYTTSAELHHRLAKLFQTLALWLDEPRLHDPALYLQGLPPVYDSQRLTDILKSDKNVWLDCCDIGMIDWELNLPVRCYLKFNKERQKKISLIQSRQMMRKIDRKANQLNSLDDAIAPPCFKALSTPLPDFPISVLLDKPKIMETLGNYLHNLTEHARKFGMKFSSNSALDFEYLDMFQEFHRNEESELRVSIPCQKKKGCKGAANLIIKFHEKKSLGMIFQNATQNRQQYEELVHEMLHEMPSDICINALCVEKSLTLLLKQWKSCQNPALIQNFENIGSCVFFLFVDMVSDSVRRFPPTMQFFSTCVELLGKAFIMKNRQQTQTLLQTILAHPKIVGLLLPIFQPSPAEDDFTEMYDSIVHTPLDVEVKFSLLSKFDFRSWLASKPSLSERISMMNVLFTALCDCGFEPPVQITMLSEIYLRKMILLLLYQFPDLFGETLRLLVDGSADHALGLNCWNEFLVSTKMLNKNMAQRELELNTEPPFLLEQEQVAGTMTWLITYYNDQRLSCNPNSPERLFTMWKSYLTPLIALYEYISRQTIATSERELASNDSQAIRLLWKRICDFFAPWIFPLTTNNATNPWSETEVVQASEFVELYTRVLIYFQHLLPDIVPSDKAQCRSMESLRSTTGEDDDEPLIGNPNILSLLWELYSSMFTSGSVPAHVLRVYHAKFPVLPWHAFQPTVAYLQVMAQICSTSGHCRSFLGCIFPRIPWASVMGELRALEDVSSLGQFQMIFFHLLLVLGNETALIKSEGSEIVTLLKAAEVFDWDLIEASMYSASCDWLVTNCNFIEILEPSSTIWSSLRLLKAASVFSDSAPQDHPCVDRHEKRLRYLHCMVDLLCKCSSSSHISPGLFGPVIEQLMDNVLGCCKQGGEANIQNITLYYMGIINLLNKVSPAEKLLDVVLETIEVKIRDLSERRMVLAMIVAACRSLASVTLMVQVVEVAIATYFNNTPQLSDVDVASGHGAVSTWSEILGTVTVPELSQREFVQECINHKSVLTLFTHAVQCLSLCDGIAQEWNILKDLTNWAASIRPCDTDTETKVLLLWHKILQLIVRQVQYGVNLKELGQQVDFLVPFITQAGEDRVTSGILGVIGLGRKSPLSVNFRLLCRALSTFLSAQLPSNGSPRVKPNAPGTVKDSAKKTVSAGMAVNATQRTNVLFHNLEGLRVNKAYSSLTRHVEFSCQFIVDSAHTLCNGADFLGHLTKELFKEKRYLDVIE